MNGTGSHRVRLEAPARVHDVLGVGGRVRVVDDRLLRVVVDLDHLARVLGEVPASRRSTMATGSPT